ncbi:MAG TPA: hypothetical protein PKH10_04865 [bacterium]|nr:hypothetical protein [bacterium]
MSLVVAIQVESNDVILAADRRGTIGDPRSLVALDEGVSKLQKYGTQAVIGIVGTPAAVITPIRLAQETIAANPAAHPLTVLTGTLKAHYHEHFGLRPYITEKPLVDARPVAIVLYADRRPHGQGLFQLPSPNNFTAMSDDRPYLMAGVSQYALYLFQRLWKQNFTIEEAKYLAAFLICETSKLDPKVGPTPDILSLTEAGIQRSSEDEIAQIMVENTRRFDSFAESFRGRRPI